MKDSQGNPVSAGSVLVSNTVPNPDKAYADQCGVDVTRIAAGRAWLKPRFGDGQEYTHSEESLAASCWVVFKEKEC